jgi:hypothetical protein
MKAYMKVNRKQSPLSGQSGTTGRTVLKESIFLGLHLNLRSMAKGQSNHGGGHS